MNDCETWHEMIPSIIDGLRQPVGSAAHDIARERIERAFTICDCRRLMETDVIEISISAQLPGRIGDHFVVDGEIVRR